jgi:hypothetical protein
VLQASSGNNPSYAWRSIYQSIWVISKGSCWRIGDGSKVKVWTDNWIPSHTNFKIITPNNDSSNIKFVKDLILPDGTGWNTDIFHNNLYPIDYTPITIIPLVNTSADDELMWMFETDGVYTVKSGYQAIQQWKAISNSTPSTSTNDKQLWKKLWSLHTIPRHKTLLWRILNNALPIRSELGKRGILCTPLCPRCNNKIETIDHVFRTCSQISKTWFGSQLNLKILEHPITNFSDWLRHSIMHLKEDTMVQIAALTYTIWHA